MAAPLWRHRDFMLLWIGQKVSQVGNQFTGLALPLIAVLALKATPAEMGILGAMRTLPFLLFGLLVGVFVDRHRRRPILIAGDLGRGIIVAAIAGLAFLGLLGIVHPYVLGFATGLLTVFFDVSYQAYLPSLVERRQLVEGKRKLEASTATAQVAGPTLAGVVIQFFSAASAMVLDAFTFFFSAATLLRIRLIEPPREAKEHPSLLGDVRDGLAVIFRDVRLWSIAGCTGTSNFFAGMVFVALFYPFAVRDLGLDAVALGLVGGLGAVGGVAGAFSARHLAKRLGVGHAIHLGIFVGGVGGFAVPLANRVLAIPLLALGTGALSFGSVVYNINQVSLRQALVPLRLQGRMNASMRFLVWGTLPVGSLVGGALGELLGVRTAITLAVAGGSLAFVWIVLSPVRSLETVPEPLA